MPWQKCASAPQNRKGGDGNPLPKVPHEKTCIQAEFPEGRAAVKRNTHGTSAVRTQCRGTASSGLSRVREAAQRDKRAKFTSLLHHLTPELMRESFYRLKRDASPGIDNVTWQEYEKTLDRRLPELHNEVQRGIYRATPGKRTYIFKMDGRKRPLGIASLEDKIVQHALTQILNQIYEVDFKGFSYGFRPGRSQHDALDALWVGTMERKVNWVLDSDIQGFFDNLDHEWLMQFIEHRIGDQRVVRLIRKWLKAGIIEDGLKIATEQGTPQGATISPLLANIYLHYVLDLWVEKWRREKAKGDMLIVRYADDFVMGFEKQKDAELFLEELRERIKQFALTLHPEKTRLIEFGRYAEIRRREHGKGRPETFDFLGFTHYCGKTKQGKPYIWRKSSRKRMKRKLQEIRGVLSRNRHLPIPEQGQWLNSVLTGYYNYHAIPGNIRTLEIMRRECTYAWLFALKRRSQKNRMPWSRYARLVERYLPRGKILHPYPNERFYAKTQDKSRMR